jgi:hypothetical protein
MKSASGWRQKCIAAVTLAVLATAVGCKNSVQQESNTKWQYINPQISVLDFILKTSSIAAAEYAETNRLSGH